MLREMSRLELAIRFAHFKVGSLDDEATDFRFALVASAAHNGPHFLKQNKRPYEPKDFMPQREKPDVGAQIKAFLLPKMKKEK